MSEPGPGMMAPPLLTLDDVSLTFDFTVETLKRRFFAADGASFSSPAALNRLFLAFATFCVRVVRLGRRYF